MSISEQIKLKYRNEFRSFHGESFQGWFEKLAIVLHGEDCFVAVRVTRGDGGLDGFVLKEGRVYQLYAPPSLATDASTARKIEADFNKAKATLNSSLKVWTFVHNSSDGSVGHLTLSKLALLNDQNPSVSVEAIGIDGLWERLEKLPNEKLASLFGISNAPNQAGSLNTFRQAILETSEAVKTVGAQVGEVQSLQLVQNKKLDKQDDGRIKSLQADLSAKLHRAQELDSRDESKEAIAIIEEVYHTARSHGLKKEQLEATLNLGFATSVRGDFNAIERRLREANKLILDVKGAWHQIQYQRLKAKVLLHKKQAAHAEKSLKKVIALSQSGDEKLMEVGLLARTDYIHLLCNEKRIDEASEHLVIAREVVEGAEGNHPVDLIADSLNACIHWAASKGDVEQIKVFMRIALRHGAGRKAALRISHILQNCANGARGMKATDIAVICADTAERLGNIAERPDIAFAAAYTAAGALAENEDFSAARERCLRLVEAAKTLGEPKLRFCLFQLLSQTSRQLGDKTTAVETAEAALRDTEGDSTALCLAKMALAEALRDSGRVKEAIEHAQTALQLSEHCDLPPGWIDQTLVLIADCAARLGDWGTAESCASKLGTSAHQVSRSKHGRRLIENRIQMYKQVRESLTSVLNTQSPLSVARTEAANSVQTANSMLMEGVIDAWKEYPKAASAIYDYWGRGNLSRAMLNMQAFPGTFNMTLEVHTVHEARQAIRLWALIADVLILIWKGPTVSSNVNCPVPWSFSNAGGGGYGMAFIKAPPPIPSEVTGLGNWKTEQGDDVATPAIFTDCASLLPAEVGRFLCEEAIHLISLGRLIVVPATGICAVNSGHGPLESLFAEACNAMPAIKGDAARFPASWVPYFSDIPLHALADVAQEHEAPLRRLRQLLIRKTRDFRNSGVTGTEAKELELEIQDSLAQFTDTQAGLHRKHGWGEAREAVATRYDGFSEENISPILVLQNMGYRWRIEHAIGGTSPESEVLPKRNEPVGTWLHPADTRPKFITPDGIRD